MNPLSHAARAAEASLKLESLHRHFEEEIRQIDRELVEYLAGFDQPGAHYAMLRYHFGYSDRDLRPLPPGQYLSRGKRLRPIICLLFCRMLRIPPEIARIVMMATEGMHSASLAHDDIQDRESVRWGRPTIHALFGPDQAINVGDALIGIVYHLLLTLRDRGVAPAAILDVIEIFNATHMRMCEGQHLDLRYKYYDEVTVADYLDMVDRKTASPCVCIADTISILASCPGETRHTLRQFGHSLGMLYQICDDIRGIWCEPDALGREAGQDLCQQRASLPLLYAFKHGSPRCRQLLRQRSADQTPLSAGDLDALRHELNACGAYRLCHDDATHHYRRALEALEHLHMDGPEIGALRTILSTCFASVDFEN